MAKDKDEIKEDKIKDNEKLSLLVHKPEGNEQTNTPFFKKLFKRKAKGKMQIKDQKRIRVKIIKKRGNAIAIENTTAILKKPNKQSELKNLKVSGGKIIDVFDTSKLNPDGSLTLIETRDGQLTYATIKDDVIGAIGEGFLRDGFVLNDDWIDKSFPQQENKLKMILGLIVFGIALMSIAISFYLTYEYWNKMNVILAEGEDARSGEMLNLLDVMDRISRNNEIALQHLATISGNLQRINSGVD